MTNTPMAIRTIPRHHPHREALLEEHPGTDRRECDAARGPDPIGDTHRHPLDQSERQEREGDDVAHGDRCDPPLLAQPLRRTQRHGCRDLGEDCAHEQQPGHARASAASALDASSEGASGFPWPVSTSTTPAITIAMPMPIVSVNGSAKITEAITAVSATPAAAQIPLHDADRCTHPERAAKVR